MARGCDIELQQVLFVTELIGVAAFAVTGALKAIEREMDIFGILVLAVITALGGGIIRDVLITRLPVSLREPIYFEAAIAGGLLVMLGSRVVLRYPHWIKLFDALGLAIFSVLGAQVGISEHLNLIAVLLLGLMTGIGGGILRDVLANEVPLVLRREIYALASLAGILLFRLLLAAGVPPPLAVVTGTLAIFLLRLAAIHWNLNLPKIRMRRG